MRTASTVSKILMWVFFALSLFFHVLAMIGLSMSNQSADAVYDLRPLFIACTTMTLAVLLFTVLPKGKLVFLIAAVLAGVLFLCIAVDLGNTFPASIGADGSDVGLTPWRLVYRHYSMLLTPLCMAVAYFTGRAADKEEQARFNQNYRSQYDLSGGPLFRDGDGDGEKKKRSVATRERKMAEQAQKEIEREERERAAAAIPLNEDAAE